MCDSYWNLDEMERLAYRRGKELELSKLQESSLIKPVETKQEENTNEKTNQRYT